MRNTTVAHQLLVLPALSAVLLWLSPQRAAAWGFNGHRIVAEIAYDRLADKPEVRAKLDALIAESGEESFAEAATWADRALFAEEITYDYRFSEKFHYLNFSEDLPPSYDNIGPACVLNSAQDEINGCVVFAIEGYASILRSKRADTLSRWEALLFVIHFVGDVHQPLHAGWAEDRGGNTIQVSLPSKYATKYKKLLDKKKKKWLSLHKVWDNLLVDDLGGNWRQTAKELNADISDADARLWADSTSADWAMESADLALRRAYRGPKRWKPIKTAYIDAGKRVARRRLQMAGVRLAALLEDALAG